jgi:ATP-dependent 26S proteasome regulatory subunit
MEHSNQWLNNNDEYLAKALAWLRLRLTRLAQQQSATPAPFVAPPPPIAETNSFNWRFWERTSHPDAGARPHLLPPAPAGIAAGLITDEAITRALAEMAAAESMSPAPALVILSARLGLSRFEQQILLLCAAMELDTRISSLCAHAQVDPNRQYPTFALAMALFDEPAWDALLADGPLRRWRLIEINQPGIQPLTSSALRVDERIVNFLKGLNYLDDRLAPFLWPVAFDELDGSLPPSQHRAFETMVGQLQRRDSLQRLPVIQLAGRDAPSKQMLAAHVAAGVNLRLYRLPVELIPSHATELETLANVVEREMALWPFALYLDAHELDKSAAGEVQVASLNRFLARSNGVFFLNTAEVWHELSCPSIVVDVARTTQSEQQAAWTEVLGNQSNEITALLATQFDLNLPTIQRIGKEALSEGPAAASSLNERLWNTCLLSVRPRLDNLAQRIEPRASWSDIVLPETELTLLRQIAAQVKHRGRVYEDWGFAISRTRGLSINALFTGDSGTGKTMAAEVIANEQHLDLYRIDLSAVVNKYIGETEKNLRRVFDAAECGGAILFFDEADALFGKRSEVKDSHDRYANIEINYLLQRLESFRGLAILATNLRNALDTAFMRRIRFVVDFRPPPATERKVIWQRIFPAQTQTSDLDYEYLARLNLNGGTINNIAINAAFLAAQLDTSVTMPLILDAARTEFVKLKRPINDADFCWQESVEAAV